MKAPVGELSPEELLVFTTVRAKVEPMGAAIVGGLVSFEAVAQHGPRWLESRVQRVFDAGLDEFDRQRRLVSDAAVPAWREPVHARMTARAVELFADPPGGSRPAAPAPPAGGGGRPEAARPPYFATRSDVFAYARQTVEVKIRAKVGSWTSDSELIDDMVQEATARSVETAISRWDAERSSLKFFIDQRTKFEVLTEYRDRCKAKHEDAELFEACAADRLSTDDVDADPLTLLVESDQRVELRHALRVAFAQLSAAQQAEISRRLAGGPAGPASRKDVYTRALKRLRRLLGEMGFDDVPE